MDLIERENTFTMKEFAASINAFLEFRKYDILQDKGKISNILAQIEEQEQSEYSDDDSEDIGLGIDDKIDESLIATN